ncbi:MAG: ATP-binding cassette domain-containing protein [Oscillospiraceae bacterium]|jgi:energy-coupling factor transport system ATP-binding protein|nr:ATP-binding cassette domain-containing protein [Oscillospiraceae bacterium]
MEAIAELREFCFTYPGATAPALREICLKIAPGEFAVLCGPSGCGKTTLLRQLKPALAPHGTVSGEIFFAGAPLRALSPRDGAQKIGFVLQNPENQVVTDKVWHELAFGLESLGYDNRAIRLRTAEMASFFGIEPWFRRDVGTLSGGQKQLLALASVMATQPDLLLLDEPTGQLDPIAAGEFLAALARLNRELGVTIILTEHRLEEALPLASQAIVMDEGRVLCTGTPAEIGRGLRELRHGMFAAMPVPMRVWAAVPNTEPCPVTVREGREWLRAPLRRIAAEEPAPVGEPAVVFDDIWFQYEKEGPAILKGLSLRAYPGEITAILGGNGAGKTTALMVMAGLRKAYRGKTKAAGRRAALPQNPHTLFAANTLRADLAAAPNGESPQKMRDITALCHLEGLLERHPYDLSGGEQQRAALAKVLLTEPDILLLDEPTKGLDAKFKLEFAAILKKLIGKGVAVVMVSHDIEFCAGNASRCILLFDGAAVAEGPPRAFFSGNSFYTTAANRMARHVLPQAITAEDIIFALGGEA